MGRDAGERFGRATGVMVGADVDAAVRAADVLIDFTRPEGTLAHLAACARHGVGAVVGTTGLHRRAEGGSSPSMRGAIPIVFAPNMSVGVNVLLALVESAARQLGPASTSRSSRCITGTRSTRRRARRSRSGEAAARGAGRELADMRGLCARQGVTGERKAGTIGFAALRGGDVVGEHTVIFAGAGERIELDAQARRRGRTSPPARCAPRSSSPPSARSGQAGLVRHAGRARIRW